MFHGFEELALCWDGLERWTTLVEGRWQWLQEHINLKEARVSLMLLRHAIRTCGNLGKKHLTISDSMVIAGIFDRGRSSSSRLLALARRAAAYHIGGELHWSPARARAEKKPAAPDLPWSRPFLATRVRSNCTVHASSDQPAIVKISEGSASSSSSFSKPPRDTALKPRQSPSLLGAQVSRASSFLDPRDLFRVLSRPLFRLPECGAFQVLGH